jgi:hypothetical protein
LEERVHEGKPVASLGLLHSDRLDKGEAKEIFVELAGLSGLVDEWFRIVDGV